MAIIVTHKQNGGRYVLLGAGFGAYEATRPSFFFGNLIPSEHGGEMPVVLICDQSGKTGWVESENVSVTSIDGESPAHLLDPPEGGPEVAAAGTS